MNNLISVIVPIYKVEKYLDKCIESIVEQTYRNLQIILVDDGSPDACPNICDKWEERDSRIIVVHKVNGGLSDARNAGLKKATGNYISFIDSDDWVQPDFFQTLYDVMRMENADIVECGVTYVAEDGKILRTRQNSLAQLSLGKIDALKKLVSEQGIYQTVWNKLYKKEVVANIQFEIGKYNEDEFWTYQVIDKADKVVVIDKALYNYLQRDTSIMGVGYSLKRMDGLEALFQRMEFLQKYDELEMLIKTHIMYVCLYHFQAAVRHLDKPEQNIVTSYVIHRMGKLPSVWGTDICFKYKIWFTLFKRFPYAVANVRNKLGIGL